MKYSIIPVTPFQQNCTLLWCEESKKAAVVDPGGDIAVVLARIAELGLELEKILLTHAHIDHAGGTAELVKQTGVPIEGPHIGDQFWIDGLPQQSQMFGFPQVEIFTPDRWLEEGDRVTVGNETLEVLHCPGHTPGHVVFYSPESQLAQVGDVLFQGSIGRTDFPKGDHATLISSIREKLFPLGDSVAFIPGHGPMSTFGHERKTNPFVSDSRG
ncbi:Glyoxylase, beta-lactamase superfamily II [Amphritea atlantica]|uniref:Glyoxylase, beta-lactamase superfamily II n=1 Tax=Amphritea atlantica TaxID=355243 RepID=A0A1H9JBE9_9GAMM|nr:MBL fold metallo-hydrolase [Amphritea atlantica]SEQ84190.1 Glyoxylase, beta-lactamase superfamily II [Amphritea atlantica]